MSFKKYTNYYQPKEDKDDDELYQYYTNSASMSQNQHTLQDKYERERANRQISHYVDPSKQPKAELQNSTTTAAPTKAQLQYWKQQKEEKKKKKDAWLFD